MAVHSIIPLRKFHQSLIFDPEHYHPDRINAISLLSKNSSSSVSDYLTEVTNLVPCCENRGGQPIFDLTDAKGWLLSDGDKPNTINSTKKVALPKDLVISRLRSYLEEVCIVPYRGESFAPLFSTEFVVLRDKKCTGASFWLLPFLLSSPVQTVFRWSQTGSNHPRFDARTLLKLPVPDILSSLRERLHKLVDTAIKIHERGKTLYPDAEKELLERLGWDILPQTKTEFCFVENTSVLHRAVRMDAEHFQPKYQRIRAQLRKLGAACIGSFCLEPTRGVQPLFEPDGDVFVFASKAIRAQGLVPDEKARVSRSFWQAPGNEKARVVSGDVLLNSTGVGTLGRASFYLGDAPAIADNHVTILRTDATQCLPVYLSLFLNSPAGIAQSEMYQTGSSGQLEIYPHHIQAILTFLPRDKKGFIDMAWQQKLADKVIGASNAKQEAQAKIVKAKRLIEEALGCHSQEPSPNKML